MKISDKNESTSHPFWIIIDPRQNFHTGNQGLHNIAGMITGVWFSREAAEEHLKAHRYNFGENARVYCHSGCYSQDWVELSKELKKAEVASELLGSLQEYVWMQEGCISKVSTTPSERLEKAKQAIKKATE